MLALRSWLACRGGNVAMMFALLLPLVIGGAAFGVETSFWYYKRLGLQAAADAAAYAAALEKRGGGSDAEVDSVARMALGMNGFTLPNSGVVVTPAVINGGGKVALDVTDTAKRFFTAYFIKQDPTVKVRAVATYNNASSACMLALSPTASKAANFAGSSNLQLTGCSVMSNSNAADAVNVQGAALLSTTCVIAVGQVSATSGLTMTQCSSPIANAPSVGDPFSDVPTPSVPSGGCQPSTANNTTIGPGRYCNGLTLKNNVTLQPGVYYIESASGFSVSANANVVGAGVTIYLSGAAHADIPSNGTVTLSAPTSGTYSGVLFFGDRSATGQNRFNGTASSRMTGAIYFANQDVVYNGNFAGSNGCTQVVGSTINWTGNTTLSADCSAYGMRSLPVLSLVRLTE